MNGWHHRLDGHGFGWTLRVGDGQGGLACVVHEAAALATAELAWLEGPGPSGEWVSKV